MTHNYIFQVIDVCDTVLVTRSESRAYQIASRSADSSWIVIVASVLDSIPYEEHVYDVVEFSERFL